MLVFLIFGLFLGFISTPAQARFDDRGVSGLAITIGDWNRPTSQITNFSEITNSLMVLDYEAEDDGLGIWEVQLWYSHNSGEWRYYQSQYSTESGEFVVEPPLGDGVYEFLTIAIDKAGNVEDKNGDGVDDNQDEGQIREVAWYLATDPDGLGLELPRVVVDRQPPSLSLSPTANQVWRGGNLVENGEFQRGDRGWVMGGEGQHHIEEDAGEKVLLLGWRDIEPVAGGTSWAYYQVSLPPQLSSYLGFNWRVISEDVVDFDWFSVWIKDDNNYSLARVLTTGSGNLVDVSGWEGDSGWRQSIYPLKHFSGRNLRIWFEVLNTYDVQGATWALINNVWVSTTDYRVSPEVAIDFEVHDASGSGADLVMGTISGEEFEYDGTLPLDVTPGERQISANATDLAENQSATVEADLVVKPSVVINAFLANPIGQDDAPLPEGEWIELYNLGEEAVEIDGWYLYDGIDTHELVISPENTESGETIIFPGESLRVYRNSDKDFSLNNTGGDQIRLYTGPIGEPTTVLIDTVTYQAEMEEGVVWRREPEGVGSWSPQEPSLGVHLVSRYSTNHKILLTIFGLGNNYGGDGKILEYEITYFDENNLQKGIFGQVLPPMLQNGKVDLEFYLGSCSAGGHCRPDLIPSRLVEVQLRWQDESLPVVDREFTI